MDTPRLTAFRWEHVSLVGLPVLLVAPFWAVGVLVKIVNSHPFVRLSLSIT